MIDRETESRSKATKRVGPEAACGWALFLFAAASLAQAQAPSTPAIQSAQSVGETVVVLT